MPKYYYNDKKNCQYVVQIRDTNNGNKIVKKGFSYRFIFTEDEAIYYAKCLVRTLLLLKELKYNLIDYI